MIKKQYHRHVADTCYFNNFLQSLGGDVTLDKLNDKLTPYDATIAKSKFNKINVKWNDPKLYAYFILRWA